MLGVNELVENEQVNVELCRGFDLCRRIRRRNFLIVGVVGGIKCVE